jgi:NAD(P)-dependent dehydrogenase (short-subunit alcohol dehydrogenase family)
MKQRATADGLEPHFGVNVVGHFLLTKLLLFHLGAATANSGGAAKARVVHLCSGAAYQSKLGDYDSLIAPAEGDWKPPGNIAAFKLFARSKLVSLLRLHRIDGR